MPTRSGHSYTPAFLPYALNRVVLPLFHEARPLHLSADIDDLVEDVHKQAERLAIKDDDSEGLIISTEPRHHSPPPSCSPLPSPSRSTSTATRRHTRLHANIEERRRSDYLKERRRARRVKAAQSGSPFDRQTRSSATCKAKLFAHPIRTPLDAATLPHSGGGSWIGSRVIPDEDAGTHPDVHKLCYEENFQYIPWDGRYVDF